MNTTIKKTWADSENENLRLIPVLTLAGWDVEFHRQDFLTGRTTPEHTPVHPVSFNKGKRHVWPTRDGWMVADLVEGSYHNHIPVDSIYDLIIQDCCKDAQVAILQMMTDAQLGAYAMRLCKNITEAVFSGTTLVYGAVGVGEKRLSWTSRNGPQYSLTDKWATSQTDCYESLTDKAWVYHVRVWYSHGEVTVETQLRRPNTDF